MSTIVEKANSGSELEAISLLAKAPAALTTEGVPVLATPALAQGAGIGALTIGAYVAAFELGKNVGQALGG